MSTKEEKYEYIQKSFILEKAHFILELNKQKKEQVDILKEERKTGKFSIREQLRIENIEEIEQMINNSLEELRKLGR